MDRGAHYKSYDQKRNDPMFDGSTKNRRTERLYTCGCERNGETSGETNNRGSSRRVCRGCDVRIGLSSPKIHSVSLEHYGGSKYPTDDVVFRAMQKPDARDRKIVERPPQLFQTDRDICVKLAGIHSTSLRNKWDVQKWGKNPRGRGRRVKNHYDIWRHTYEDHIRELFERIKDVKSFKDVKHKDISFEDFVNFTYELSKGYITPYI